MRVMRMKCVTVGPGRGAEENSFVLVCRKRAFCTYFRSGSCALTTLPALTQPCTHRYNETRSLATQSNLETQKLAL